MMLQNGGDVRDRLIPRGWTRIDYPHGGTWVMQSEDPDIGPDILDSFYLTYADTDLI